MNEGVAEILSGRSICVCAGSGGVGKTTTSAAIAAGMAAQGLKVAVLTIDPARRLANSLGLPELGNEERQVDPAVLEAAGLGGDGELWAMMLDAKRTFDELVERHAPDERSRDAILSNRVYQELSNAVAGSQEYMAMEKLYELHHEQRYDLLVLDTPPTRNALDFLDAPERLSRFVDSRSLQFFLKPSRTGLRLLGRGTGLMFSVLKRVTGVDMLQDLSEFFQSFGDMAEGFSERAHRVNELLSDQRAAFFVITSPRRAAVDEAVFFHRRLRERHMPSGGVIVNRMTMIEDPGDEDVEDDLVALLGDSLGRRVARNFEDYREIARGDRANLERLERELGREPMILVPHLEDDVHDAAGLARMNEYLFAGRGSRVAA
ncbi:MAG: ArsA family ATPase [Thermoleophilaceae bacterium]